jgi:hypothetical protein
MQSEHNAGDFDTLRTRVFSLNFPSVFTYVQPRPVKEEKKQLS